MSTKILAINGSPRGRKSNTDKILQPFLAGAKEAGAVAETIYAVDLDVHDCTGCFSCWKKTPGKCIFNDDMPALLEKIRKADIIVWATPLYYYGMTARLQRVMERTLPLATPYIIKQGEHFSHPSRYQDNPKKTVLISNCGFIERYYFEALLKQFSILDKQERSLDNTILCTAGEMLAVPEAQQQISWYLDAAYEAGKEFVRAGKISAQTATTLSKDFVALETFIAMANASWNIPGETPPTLDEAMGRTSLPTTSDTKHCEPLIPTPQLTTIRDVIAGMPLAFQPQAAGSLKAIIAFYVTDAADEKYFLKIEDGQCSAFAGVADRKPDITIHTPTQVWMDLSSGKIDGQQAFMEGQYHVEGNIQILIMFSRLFKSADSTVVSQPASKKKQY